MYTCSLVSDVSYSLLDQVNVIQDPRCILYVKAIRRCASSLTPAGIGQKRVLWTDTEIIT